MICATNNRIATSGYVLSASFTAVATWILALFLLPALHAGRFVVPSIGSETVPSNVPFAAYILACACAALIWCSYTDARQNGRYVAAALLLTGCLLAFVAFGVLSHGTTPSGQWDLLQFLVAVLAGLLSARMLASQNQLVTILAVIATVQAVSAIYGAHTTAAASVGISAGATILMLLGLPGALVRAVNARNSPAMAGWLFSASAIIGALILTWNRGALIGAVVGLAWMLWRLIEQRRSAVTAALVAALAIPVLLIMHLPHAQGTRLNAVPADSVRSTAPPAVPIRNALTGLGGSYLSHTTTFVDYVQGSRTVVAFAQPANEFAYWYDEAGVAGLLLVLCLAIVSIRIVATNSSPTAVCVGGMWLSLLAAGLFGVPFGASAAESGNVLFGVLLGATMLLPGSRGHSGAVGGGKAI